MGWLINSKIDWNILLSLVFGVVSLVSVLFTIHYGRKAARLERDKKSLTWPQLQLLADAMCFKLKRDGFIPDLILAPGSRGAILAELMLNKFSRNIPAVVGISFMEFSKKPMPSIQGYSAFPIGKGWNIYIPDAISEFRNGKVLIVDDFCLTGVFFQEVRAFLLKLGFDEKKIRVFCAVITKVTQAAHRAPEYYHVVTDDDYFYFPWGKAHTG